MMNDNSQQTVLITVLFIPERKKGGKIGLRVFYELRAVEKLNTSINAES